MLELVSCRWISAHQNLIITGATGIGKTFLPCALGEKACREGFKVTYGGAPRLFGELYRARADGTYSRLLQRLAKRDLLIISLGEWSWRLRPLRASGVLLQWYHPLAPCFEHRLHDSPGLFRLVVPDRQRGVAFQDVQ